jgi:hypothetical protein
MKPIPSYLKVKFGEEVWHDESYNDMPPDFFGRQEAKEQTMEILRSPDTRRAIWIIGERRAGKTSMLRLLLEKCKKEDFIAIEIPWHSIHSTEDFYREFLCQLDNAIISENSLLIDSSLPFWDAFHARQKVLGQNTVVVGIDEIDSIILEQVDEDSRREILGSILRLVTFEKGIKVILTSVKPSSQIEKFRASSLVSKSHEIFLRPFSKAELDDLLNSIAPNLPASDSEYIMHVSGGWVYYAKAILFHLLQLSSDGSQHLETARLAAVESIAQTCEHLYRHHWNEDERRVLWLLTNKEKIQSELINNLDVSFLTAVRELTERGYISKVDGFYSFRVFLIADWFKNLTRREIEEEQLEIPLLLKKLANHGNNKLNNQAIRTEDGLTLREWWHHVIRDYGKFSSYAMFLLLPSDKEAIQYLTEYDKELSLISDKDCLVLVVTKGGYNNKDFEEDNKQLAIKEYILEGYSVRIAHLFGIKLDTFPCLVVFQDIRSSEHIIVSFKGMTASEIASKIRSIFSIIHSAIIEKQNPLAHVQNK